MSAHCILALARPAAARLRLARPLAWLPCVPPRRWVPVPVLAAAAAAPLAAARPAAVAQPAAPRPAAAAGWLEPWRPRASAASSVDCLPARAGATRLPA